MGGDRDGNPNVTTKVTRDVCFLARWMAADLYIREIDSLRFELSMKRCSDELEKVAYEILEAENEYEECHRENGFHQTSRRAHAKHSVSHRLALPTQLLDGADMPACTECNDGESQLPILEFPVTDHSDSFESGHNAESSVTLLNSSPSRISEKYEDGKLDVDVKPIKVSTQTSSSGTGTGVAPANSTVGFGFSSPRKKTSEFNAGKSSFDKILNPSITQRPYFTPYRIVLGHVREKLIGTRRRIEEILEGIPYDYDPSQYYEKLAQLLEPLMLCYESMQSCGSDILAEGCLADLIQRVSTFEMILMKLDLHQESGKHSETLDAIIEYLDMGTYSEWDEEKKLEFLVTKLKGKVAPCSPNY